MITREIMIYIDHSDEVKRIMNNNIILMNEVIRIK